MKTFKKYGFRLLIAVTFILTLSSGAHAQNNRGGRHGNAYGGRPRISVGIGYNPYLHFRPVLRPRIYYHPPYRLPYRYVHYGPAFGFRIGVLPFGYNQFYIGGDPFYYYDGIYYRPYTGGGYEVTQPPLGAMVKHLPTGAKVTVIDGQKYYELGGTFYQERTTANNKTRYEVVGTDGVLNTTNADIDDDDNDATQAPPATAPAQGNNSQSNNNTAKAPANGSIVTQVPAGSTSVIISQQKYFLSPTGVYYEEMIDGNNKVTYKVAGTAATGIQEDAPAAAAAQ